MIPGSSHRYKQMAFKILLPYLLGLVILEFNVQAVFNADFHFDRVVDVSWHSIRVYPDILFMNKIGKTTRHSNTYKVSEKRGAEYITAQ